MRIEIYKGKGKAGQGGWRWRMVARNGRNIGNSGESYKNKNHCLKMIDKIVSCGKWKVMVK